MGAVPKREKTIAVQRPRDFHDPNQVGKYLLFEKIGFGGMAEVFLGKTIGEAGIEKILAIKRILPGFLEDREVLHLFEFEAKISISLSHPNIVHIYDFAKAPDGFLLIMEFVWGKTLIEVVKRLKQRNETLSTDLALYIVSEVLKALVYAHEKTELSTGKPLNIVHRDVSPKNIMISYDSGIKLLDFGIAKARDRSRMTRSGSIRGTVRYLSPERITGERDDHLSDQFSAGLMLLELLSGTYPFETNSDYATMKKIQECEGVTSLIESLKTPEELKTILRRALARDPKDRYPNTAAFLFDLQEFSSGHFSIRTSRQLGDLVSSLFESEKRMERERMARLEKLQMDDPHYVTANGELRSSAKNSVRKTSLWPFLLLGVGIVSIVVTLLQLKGLQPFTAFLKREEPPKAIEEEYCSTMISSQPNGAVVYLNGIRMGLSPMNVRVECGKSILLVLEHAGFTPFSTTTRFSEKTNQVNYPLRPTVEVPVPKVEAPLVKVEPPPVKVEPPPVNELKPPPAPREKPARIDFFSSPISLKSPPNGEEFFEGDEALSISFNWRAKPIPKEQDYVYLIEVGDSPEFNKKLGTQKTKGTTVTKWDLALPPGKYFWRTLLIKGKNTVIETSAVNYFIYRERPLPLPPNTKVRLLPGNNSQ